MIITVVMLMASGRVVGGVSDILSLVNVPQAGIHWLGPECSVIYQLNAVLLSTILAETRPSVGKVLQAKTFGSTSALLALFITNLVSLVSEVSGVRLQAPHEKDTVLGCQFWTG